MREHPRVLFAGQISGGEGYVESIATGLMAGIHAAVLFENRQAVAPPRATAFGSLTNYIAHAETKTFQPANITFDLLPPWPEKIRDKKLRHQKQCELALQEFAGWLQHYAAAEPSLRS
jgi:methylenetetrahydrofolate--tRNA-(uracil-5-)-methyltransferase